MDMFASSVCFCLLPLAQPRLILPARLSTSAALQSRRITWGTALRRALGSKFLRHRFVNNDRPPAVLVMSRGQFSPVQLPKSFEEMRQQATENGIEGIRSGVGLVEINFPSVPNMATAALNQLLDANREYTRQFIQACRTRAGLDALEYYSLFPDKGEVKLAAKSFAEARIKTCTFETAASVISGDGNGKGVIVVVQPGFNIDEWIRMEELQQFDLPIVTINADLDKVRSPSYYPKWFYPGLHKCRTRFLLNFKEVYYIKFLSNAGTLLKLFHRPWTLFYKQEAIWQGESEDDRPEFKFVEKLLAQARENDLTSSR